MSRPPALLEALFAGLLRLHPRSFRERYSEDLVVCFREGWRHEVAGRGPLRAAGYTTRALLGVVATAARQRFASMDPRGEDGTMTWDSMMGDLRLAVRGLRRRPSWSAVVVLTLGLGMGATTAVFSVLNGVLLAPLPYAHGDRLVRVYLHNVVNGMDGLYLSAPAAAELRDQTRSFDAVAILQNHDVEGATLGGVGAPERLGLLRVNADYFEVLGTEPYLGRTFERADETSEARVAVVSQRLWEQSLGAEHGDIGRSILLDEEAYTVIGVVPGSPRDPLAGAIDVWLPADLEGAAGRTWENNYLSAFARLAPGADLASARAELGVLTERHAGMGEAAAEKGYTILSLKEDLVGDVRPLLTALMGAVAFLFLLTCTNVASLMLARAATREHEFAIRRALGSGRRQLLAQAFVEAAVVAALGGAAGLLVGSAALDSLLALAPLDLPLRDAVGVGPAPILFAAALSVVVAVGLGLAVALPYAAGAPRAPLGLRAGQGGVLASRTRDALVVVDVAFAVVLLVGAGLLLRTMGALRAHDLGVDPTGVIAFQVDLPETRYAPPEARIRFQDDLLARLRAIPGVVAAGSASHLPVTGSHSTWGTRPASLTGVAADLDNIAANQRFVDEGYFAALGIELVAGRGLEGVASAEDVPSVVIDRTAARRLFGDGDPLGQRLAVGPLRPVVVGVVEDVSLGARLGPAPTVYHAYDQFGAARRWSHHHVVRVAAGLRAPWAEVRAAVAEVDPELVVHGTTHLEDVVGQDVAEERFAGLLLRAFAGLGVLLTALGLVGVLSHGVERRRHEIGVRIALGAAAVAVRTSVLRRGVALSAAGSLIGLAGAYALTGWLDFLVYGVSPRDPLVFAGTPILIGLVAVAASWLPARRATAVDPLELLRSE